MTWLSQLVDQHKQLESPLNFWWWGGMAAISAVVKDKVWLDRGAYKLYPNVYIMFHADSGLKKGPPVNMAKKLVQEVGNTKIITGRASIQGILKKLGTGETVPGKKPNLSSTGFICLSELTAGIVEDPVATKILTDLYDRHYNDDEWESLLKGEQFTLKDPTVTMLSATNDSMSEDFLTSHAIKGGFLARTFIIHESTRHVLNSLVIPLTNPPDYKESAKYLKELSELRGEFTKLGSLEPGDFYPHERIVAGEKQYFSDAGLRYDEWYRQFWHDVEEQGVVDSTGTLNRFGDAVLKIAMLLSLADSTKLEITVSHIDQAIEMAEKLVGNTRKATFKKVGSHDSAPIKATVLELVLKHPKHRITRREVHQKFFMSVKDVNELDNLMVSICEAGLLEVQNEGSSVIYQMPQTIYDWYVRQLAGKLK